MNARGGAGTRAVYVDTSALAKWYLHEARSDEVEAFLMESCPVCISALTRVEMRSLVARRRCEGDLDPLLENRVLSTFDGDVATGHLVLLPHSVESFLLAESLMGSLPGVPLRTLDALHLGTMRAAAVPELATADRIMAQAAALLSMDCVTFF